LAFLQPANSVKAAPILTITPITWNVIGLDSNNVNVGPNNFPVGIRVCNEGTTSATNVQADFVWDSVNAYVNIRPGSLDPISIDELANGDCFDFYFEVEITRNSAAYGTTRRFHIEITADFGISLSTPRPREIFVERLVSQNRNASTDVKLEGISIPVGGTMTLMVGETYTITLIGSTATNGYEQIENFINFPNTIFQVLNVQTIYSADSSPIVDNPDNKLYGDGCRWENDPNSPNYRSCLSSGKAGGKISVTYLVKIIAGSGTSSILNTLIYDFSGSSYHYNADFATTSRIVTITSAEISKSFSPKSINPGATSTLTFNITNPSPNPIDGLSFTDTLPNDLTIALTTINYSGCGTPAPAALGVGDTSLSISNITIAGSGTCAIAVTVTASQEKQYNNESGNLFIDDQDTGDNASDSLIVASAAACLPDQVLATWTFPAGSSATTPGFTTKAGNVSIASASTTSITPTIETNTNYGNPAPSWAGDNYKSGAYFQFQVDTSRYSDIKISFNHILTTASWNSATVTLSSSTNGISYTANGTSLLSASMGSSIFTPVSGANYFRISATGAQNDNSRFAIDNVTIRGCLIPAPAPTLIKSFSPDPIVTGQNSTLSFTISNTAAGNVAQTGISFNDKLPNGLSIGDSTASVCGGTNNLTTSAANNTITLTNGSLNAGGSCTFNVSVKGVLKGAYENITGFLSSNESGLTSSYAQDTLAVIAPPQVTKTFSANSILTDSSTNLSFILHNPNSSQTLTGVSFTDILPLGLDVINSSSIECGGNLTALNNAPMSDTVTLTGGSLAPGATCVISVSVAGTSVGLKENSVTISAAETGNGNTSSANILVRYPSPAIGFLKQVGTTIDGPWSTFVSVNENESIYYRFTVENKGDITLSGISLADPAIDTSSCEWRNGNGVILIDDDLALPGFTFTLPTADNDEEHVAICVLDPILNATSGSHRNTATITSGQTEPVASSATYATPNLNLSKSAQEAAYTSAGDIIHYDYLVENDGHVPLAGPVMIADDKATVLCAEVDTIGDLDNFLDPGEQISCESEYSITSQDVTTGSVTNLAQASAGGISSNEDQVYVPYNTPPDLKIVKSNDTDSNGTIGTSFIWTLTVLNEGDTDAVFSAGERILTDSLPDGASYGTPSVSETTSIVGQANITCNIVNRVLDCSADGSAVTIGGSTGSFKVSVSVDPVNGGNLENTASIDPDLHINETNEDNNSDINTVFIAGPGLDIIKKVSIDQTNWLDRVTLTAGEPVYFKISVSNTGNVPLSGISILDNQCTLEGPTGDTNTDENLDVTEIWEYTCSINAQAGSHTNTASANSNETTRDESSAEYFGNDADLSIQKKVSSDNSSWQDDISINIGSAVYYQIALTNTGNIPLTNVNVIDNNCSLNSPTGDANTNSQLDTDETWIYTCSVTAESGEHTNTATVTSDQSSQKDESAKYFGQDADLTIEKDADLTDVSVQGEVITYTIRVSNIGNVNLKSLNVTDPLVSGLDCDDSTPGDQNTNLTLSVGGNLVCLGSYTVTQNDLDTNGGGNGKIINIATATDTTTSLSKSAEAEVSISVSEMIGAAKRVEDISESSSGNFDVIFKIVIKNYGQNALANVQATDDLTSAFPLPTVFSVQTIESNDFAVNPNFDGNSDQNLLAAGNTLEAGEENHVTLVVRVVPTTIGPYENSVFTSATHPVSGQVTDISQNGSDPDSDNDGDPKNNNEPTPVDFGPRLFDPPFGIKRINPQGRPILEWTMLWINHSNVASVYGYVHDPVPTNTTFYNTGNDSGYPVPAGAPIGSTSQGVSCSAKGVSTTSLCYYEGPSIDHPLGQIIWEGTIGPDFGVDRPQDALNAVSITYNALLQDEKVTRITNRAVMNSDLNGDGDANDPGEADVAVASEIWDITPLPATGFAPNLVTQLPVQPESLSYTNLNELFIEIPSLDIRFPIVGVSQATGAWDLTWLGGQAGWLEGTAFPSWAGNSAITAHVVDASGQPGPFASLHQLKWGDEVVIEAWGQRYVYEVREIEEWVDPDLIGFLPHEDYPWLTLITCRGYNQQTNSYDWRVLVRAVQTRVD
jgi:LPXTG-site transpeptidase (sortase) family protein